MFSSFSRAAWARPGTSVPAPAKAAAHKADCCMKLRREILLLFAMFHSLFCCVFLLEVPQRLSTKNSCE
jgi:hypothetical protein